VDGAQNDSLVKVNLTGASCPNTTVVWNGYDCVAPKMVTPGQPLVNQTIPDNSSYVFSVSLSTQTIVSQLTITVSDNVDLCLNFQTGRIGSICDYSGNTTIPAPPIGTYIGIVTPKSGRNNTFTLSTSTVGCPWKDDNRTIGPGCSLTYLPLGYKTLSTGNLQPSGWIYYQVNASLPDQPFWITVVSPDGPAPQVIVSLGQIPTIQEADVRGCNQPNCENTIINLNTSALPPGNYTFYVGVYSNTSSSYGIWSGSVCAPGCETNGDCTTSGVKTGSCVCKTDYAGIDCSAYNQSGLPAQYIVLIIIASLVVASAIIGFIAWAYMQKKRRGDYSPVASERA